VPRNDFFIILATAISGMPKPEIAFYRGSWGERSCPRGATASHSVSELDTQPSNWEAELYHWAIATLAKSSSSIPMCQVMLRCVDGELLRNQR